MPPTPRLARLLHPAFLASVALLLVNDHVLKSTAPGVVTGKLSDVAGLVVLPVLLCVLGGVSTRRAAWAVHGLVGAVFALMQFVPAGDWLSTLGRLVGTRLRHTADPTDLLTLAVLPLGVWIVCTAPPRGRPGTAWLRVPALGTALLAVLGTSAPLVQPLMNDTPLLEAPNADVAFARMEQRLRAVGLDVTLVKWGDPSVLPEGTRRYRIAFRQSGPPSDTLSVEVQLWTRWASPVLLAESSKVQARWISGRRDPLTISELHAVVQARVLAPLSAAGVDTDSLSTRSSAPRR